MPWLAKYLDAVRVKQILAFVQHGRRGWILMNKDVQDTTILSVPVFAKWCWVKFPQCISLNISCLFCLGSVHVCKHLDMLRDQSYKGQFCYELMIHYHSKQDDKNIKKHTAHTIVSWPNTKQWVNSSYFRFDDDNKTKHIFSPSSQGRWVNWKHTAPYIV